LTLIVAAVGKESIWLLADRRLSNKGRALRDDAFKILSLEATDGAALLGYTGLGMTAAGTEPSDWMCAVLRERNLPIEKALGTLGGAMRHRLPEHMGKIGARTHTLLAPAFVGGRPRLYSIDIVPDRGLFQFRRHVAPTKDGAPTEHAIPLGAGGSGAAVLEQDRSWRRTLRRLVKAHDRGSASTRTVADISRSSTTKFTLFLRIRTDQWGHDASSFGSSGSKAVR